MLEHDEAVMREVLAQECSKAGLPVSAEAIRRGNTAAQWMAYLAAMRTYADLRMKDAAGVEVTGTDIETISAAIYHDGNCVTGDCDGCRAHTIIHRLEAAITPETGGS